ncbi:hypothetical protein JCM19239_1104 [Vibrio variabilis]|uniref:Uncharacterized protein n=1 Tax=Vibrio variabilis TaxID=990271 RepID=A0ABQ0JEA6_9VIBR|nr:hypothetical protein JCM19239_1104 [Vibrio variabilis]
MFSTLHFVITTLLAITCAKAIGVSDGDISVLALVIPALWILPRKGASGLVLLAGMLCYGLTLPHQSISLSVTQWTLFPLLFVAFSNAATATSESLPQPSLAPYKRASWSVRYSEHSMDHH